MNLTTLATTAALYALAAYIYHQSTYAPLVTPVKIRYPKGYIVRCDPVVPAVRWIVRKRGLIEKGDGSYEVRGVFFRE